MEEQFQLPQSDNTHHLDDFILNTLSRHNSSKSHHKTLFFSPGEIQYTINNLPTKRAPGPDAISNCAFKYCSQNIILTICHILNGCVRLEYFPKCWKKAEVIMLPKPGKDPKLPKNYRPISLLNTLSKVYERLILQRLSIHTLPKTRLEQFGFRPQHSTTLQLVNVLDDIIIHHNKRRKTAAALLDIEKAFDRVWHDGLIFKLIITGVPTQIVNIIKSFLQNRSFYVKSGNCNSSSRQIRAGVPQGSCLSPQLFSIYVNDMPLLPSSKLAMFADDTLLYSTNVSNSRAIYHLQRQINKIQPWFDQWRITINPTKTSAILFSNKSTIRSSKIKIHNTPIKWSSSIKYLGITIDKKLNFSKHLSTTLNKAQAARFSLYPVINFGSNLPLSMKLHIYKSYIRPIATYASEAWFSNLSQSNIIKLEAFQSKILRSITNLPWFVSNKTIQKSVNIPSISEFSKSTSKILQIKIINSPFNHISSIANKTITTPFTLNGKVKNRPIQF